MKHKRLISRIRRFSSTPQNTTFNNTSIAASQLRLAKQLIEKGTKNIAKKRLEELIQEYPETEAANEARELLKTL